MTLRARLLIVVAAIVVAVTASAFVIISTQRHFLIDQIDNQLRTASGPLSRLPRSTANLPQRLGTRGGRPPQLLSDLWVGEIDKNGHLVQRAAPGLSVRATPRVDVGTALAAAHSGQSFNVPAATGSGTFRMRAVERSDGTTVVLGISLNRVDQSSNRLLLALTLGAGLIVAIVALLVWWVWRLGLRPVRRITETAEAITGGELDQRADVVGTRNESARLAAAFNTMLDAREQAEDRLRRFVADASHELRTPLTSIRGYSTLYRRGGFRDRAAVDDAMRRIGQEATRMHVMVDDLLLLAQLDQGRPLASDTVDLAAIVNDVATDALAVDPHRPVQVDVVEPLATVGDDHRLRQVVAALVTNALVHTAGEVRIRGFSGATNHPIIEVSDDGPGMDTDVATHAFERFFRGDVSRSRSHGGAGLGLAIVQSIVVAHDGVIELETNRASGTTFRLRFRADSQNLCKTP
jgi:two-component system OmpR family sensor kinase